MNHHIITGAPIVREFAIQQIGSAYRYVYPAASHEEAIERKFGPHLRSISGPDIGEAESWRLENPDADSMPPSTWWLVESRRGATHVCYPVSVEGDKVYLRVVQT